MNDMKKVLVFFLVVGLGSIISCRTKSEIRREQEFEKLKQEVTMNRGDRADVDSSVDDVKVEIAKIGNVIEEEAQGRRKESEEIRKELTALSARMQALEQRAVTEELNQKQLLQEKPKVSLESGRRFYDDGKYDDAIDTFKNIVKATPNTEDGKRAQFLLGESYFSSKDYASSALEFSEFRKRFPKDALIPNAIYRQAASFKGMGKSKEARLFFQDLIERFPRSPFASKAKVEMKKAN